MQSKPWCKKPLRVGAAFSQHRSSDRKVPEFTLFKWLREGEANNEERHHEFDSMRWLWLVPKGDPDLISNEKDLLVKETHSVPPKEVLEEKDVEKGQQEPLE